MGTGIALWKLALGTAIRQGALVVYQVPIPIAVCMFCNNLVF
jgi:hypothetical protein